MPLKYLIHRARRRLNRTTQRATPFSRGRRRAALGLALLASSPLPAAAQTPPQSPSQAPPPWHADSGKGLFRVTLGPQHGAVRINAMQPWVVAITDNRGQPVTAASVLIDGGMRAHGHGLPTRPQVTQHLGEGRYLIEGLRLNMVGAWTLLVGIEAGGRRDLATFELEIDY